MSKAPFVGEKIFAVGGEAFSRSLELIPALKQRIYIGEANDLQPGPWLAGWNPAESTPGYAHFDGDPESGRVWAEYKAAVLFGADAETVERATHGRHVGPAVAFKLGQTGTTAMVHPLPEGMRFATDPERPDLLLAQSRLGHDPLDVAIVGFDTWRRKAIPAGLTEPLGRYALGESRPDVPLF